MEFGTRARLLLIAAALASCTALFPDRVPPLPLAFPSADEPRKPEVVSSRVLVDKGGYLDWCARSNQIAFSRQEKPTLSEIHLIGADGSGERCLTCNHPALPQPPVGLDRSDIGAGYRSNPAWHPSCEFLVFQIGNANFATSPFERPPFGVHNDLWLISADGTRAERLIATELYGGVMSAFFSAEGDRLVWSERHSTEGSRKERPLTPSRMVEDPFQGWTIVSADFRRPAEGPAQLENRREWLQGEPGVKRASALVGNELWFAHTRGTQRFVDEIWSLDLDSNTRENLSRSPRTWEEQALPSPWGSLLAYRSSLPYGWRMGPHRPNRMRLELWALDAKGNRTQLTAKNRVGDNDLRALVQDVAWGPSGRELAIYTTRYEEGQEPRFPIEILRLDHAY